VLGTTQPKTMNGWFDQDCQTTLNVNKWSEEENVTHRDKIHVRWVPRHRPLPNFDHFYLDTFILGWRETSPWQDLTQYSSDRHRHNHILIALSTLCIHYFNAQIDFPCTCTCSWHYHYRNNISQQGCGPNDKIPGQ
jgi:hypothetical protein